jgi:ribose transport system substrate-binding protein
LSLTCVNISNGAANAAKALGWTTHVCDGQLNPTVWGGCIRQAIAAKADAAITEGIDCDTAQAPLQEAKSAHMPVINIVGFDCNDPAAGGGQPLFTATVQMTSELSTVASYYEATGRAQADWIIAKTNGHANVIEIVEQTTIVTYINKGLEQEFSAACAGCKIVDRIHASITQADVPAKVSTAMIQHPEANALPVPFDATFILGLQRGLVSSGAGSKLQAIGVGGNAPNMEYIGSGQGQKATVGQDFIWFGWAAVDTALRVLAGQSAAPEGCGFQVVDKDHNLPPAGSAFTAPVDYQSAYKKAWSGG